jgi:hypothetical protein
MRQPLVKKEVKKTLSGDFAKILIIKSKSFQPFPREQQFLNPVHHSTCSQTEFLKTQSRTVFQLIQK